MFSKFIIYNFQDIYEQVIGKSLFYKEGIELLDSYKRKIKESLNNYYLKEDEYIDASSIEKRWFPEIECDVFISHSHKDKEQIVSFIGWLYKLFGIRAFIDDAIWDNVDELANRLSTKIYQDRLEDTFITEEQANSYGASNAFLILNSAIERMIDKAECFLFIGTRNSLIDGDTHTKSPWIYTENLFSNLVKQKPLSEYRNNRLAHSREGLREAFEISYKCDFGSYVQLTRDDLTALVRSKTSITIAEENLDMLYAIKKMVNLD